MRARVLVALASAAAVPALFIAATAAPASAHVLKTVGPYHLLIGFEVSRAAGRLDRRPNDLVDGVRRGD